MRTFYIFIPIANFKVDKLEQTAYIMYLLTMIIIINKGVVNAKTSNMAS